MTLPNSPGKLFLKAVYTLLGVSMLCSASFIHAAESTRYVADMFYVPLHSGKSIKHRIVHRGIKTGTQLTLLEADAEAGFSRVRTSGGTEGWIQNQYISEQPIARTRVVELSRQVTRLQASLGEAKSQGSSLNSENSKIQAQVQQLSRDNQALTSELASIKKISANAINLDINNRELLQKNEILKIEIAELQADNARLNDKSDKEWFLRGAFAVAIGALLAVVLPRFKPKPKSGEWA